MQDRYLLILVSLNPDGTDLSGIKYPDSGYVEAPHYRADQDITSGLYGTLWGDCKSTKWVNPDPQAVWKVISVERGDEVVELDSGANFVKFRNGMVVCCGDQQTCREYIQKAIVDVVPWGRTRSIQSVPARSPETPAAG